MIAQSQSGTGKTTALVLSMLSRVDTTNDFTQVKFRNYLIMIIISCSSNIIIFGEQGWHSGESARLPPIGPIPGPGVIRGLSLLLVLYSAPRGFSPGTLVFPSPQKPTF